MSKTDRLEVINKDTGEIIDNEILESILKERRLKRKRELQKRFNDNTITLIELEELVNLKSENINDIKIRYTEFFMFNMNKRKPSEISYSDYGKFVDMLNYFITYENTLEYRSNGKTIKRKDLADFLDFKNVRSLDNFIRKLSNHKLLMEAKKGGINYLFINPVYAQRNVKINATIFKLFKEDIEPFLNEYQIRYLEIQGEDFEISSVIAIQE